MARIEKTVFISYRRKDISWALAVYQYLTSQKYDVFFDFSSIPSGDFEQIIVSNIKARAHFVLILTPTALDRCSQPGDWLRREIEIAIDEKRNVIPLFFDGFSFGSPTVAEKLTGKLGTIKRYNGLDIPSGYFLEAMERLRHRYLNVPLDAVIHPVSTEVRKVVKEEQIAANKVPVQQIEGISARDFEILQVMMYGLAAGRKSAFKLKSINLRPYGIGAGILVVAVLGIFGIRPLLQKIGAKETATPIQAQTSPEIVFTQASPTFTPIVPTNTATDIPPTPVPAIGIGSTMISPKDGMTLLYVPAGEFVMGSNNGESDEKPIHTVNLDTFWIDQTEVTNAMFTNFTDETGYTTDAEKAGKSYAYRNNSWQQLNGADWLHPLGPASGISEINPVIHVSWNDANAYCAWVNRRLPTEAEWEKAARGTDQRVYPWGNEWPTNNFLNYNSAGGGTTEVGKYSIGASPYGALDMAGNVWEWVADWYSDMYYQNSPSVNPLGPDSGQYRVLRGGSFYYFFDFGVRSADRLGHGPAYTNFTIGFRCARLQ